MRRAKRIRLVAETGMARLGMAILPRLPRRMIVSMARTMGYLAYMLAPGARRVGEANLDLTFGKGLSRREKRVILIESFRTFALVLLDLFWFNRDGRRRMAEWVRLDKSFERLREPLAHICISAHYGNWELLGKSVGILTGALTSVAAPLENAAVDRMFNEARRGTGQDVVSKQGAVRQMLKTLRRGGNVAILLDQNTKPTDGGLYVRFFNREVPISSIAAILQQHTHARLVFSMMYPNPDGSYAAVPLDDIPVPASDEFADRDELRQTVTQAIATRIEAEIRKRPQYWLWMYKRWKHVPPWEDIADYPYYAKPLRPADRNEALRQHHSSNPAIDS